MAISAKVITIDCPASTGSVGYTGVGFTPKCMIALWTKRTTDGTSVDYDLGYGFAGAGPTYLAQNGSSQDNAATSNSDRTFSSGAFIRHRNHNNSVIFAATVTSYDADGFTLNWSAVTSGVDVHILCLGGADISNAVCGTWQKPNGTTGNQAVTGVGFQPDAVFFACNEDNSSASSSLTSDEHGIGAITATAQWVQAFQTRTSQSTATRTNRYQRTDKCIAYFNEGSQVIAGEASAVSLDSDGFTVNWTTSDAQQSYQGYLALKFGTGYACAIGAETQKTSTGTKATNIGITPIGLFLASFGNTATTSVVTHNRHSLGVASSTSARGSVWSGSSDNVTDDIDDQDSDTTKVLKFMTEGTPTTEAAADLSSFDTGGFTLDWTTADATARQFVYAAFGAALLPVASAGQAPSWFG